MGFGKAKVAPTVPAAVPEATLPVTPPPASPAESAASTESGMDALIAVVTYGKHAWVVKPLCIFGRSLHMASANASKLSFDAHSYVTLVVTAFGGGILTPLVLGARPAPLAADAILVAAMVALYLFTATRFGDIYALAPVKIFGLILEAIFRTNLICSFVATASQALPSALGPIVCGAIAGIGGQFLPFTKGFDALKPPLPSSTIRVLLTAASYAVATRPRAYNLSFDPASPTTAKAVTVACNAAYDVALYLGSSTLFLAPPSAKPADSPPRAVGRGTLEALFVFSTVAVGLGAVLLQVVEGIQAIDALYLSAATFATVQAAQPSLPEARVVFSLLALVGSGAFTVTTHHAYAAVTGQFRTSPTAAAVLLLSFTSLLTFLEPAWSFSDAATFALGFAATTGSNLSPTTDEAKVAVILFALVSKPAYAALAAGAMSLFAPGVLDASGLPTEDAKPKNNKLKAA